MLNNTAENFDVKEVSADKAYFSHNNLKAVDELGVTAYIPFKSNAVARAIKPRIWKRMYYLFMYQHDEFLQHYHKRSNAETVFHMIKAKFGDKLRSKNKAAQQNELLCKLIVHNIVVLIHEMHELGIKPEFCS